MDILSAITEHENSLVGVRSQATVLTYRNGIKHFLEFLNEKRILEKQPIELLTPNIFIEFPMWLGKQGYPKSTTSSYLAGVKSFMDFLLIKGVIEINYADSLRWKTVIQRVKSKRESKLPRFPKPDDVPNMLKTVRVMAEESPKLERNIALLELLSSTGCRNDEVRKMRIKDVNLSERSIVVNGKGNKERKVFFSPEALDAMRRYIKVRGFGVNPNHPLFCRHDKGIGKKIEGLTTTTIRDIVRDVARIAGVKPFSPHYFRHAFAIKLLRETKDLTLVQDLLGHDDPASTRIYAKIYKDDLMNDYRKVYG